MKKHTSASSTGLAKPVKSNLCKSVVLSISMVALSSATAYAEGYPRYAGLTLETVTLKGDHVNDDSLTLTYRDAKGNKVVKSTDTVSSKTNSTSLIVTPAGSTGWFHQANGLECDLSKSKCEVKALKNGVKSKLINSDFKNIETVKNAGVGDLKREIAILRSKMDELIKSDFSRIKVQLHYRVLAAQYYRKTYLLQFIQDPPTVPDLKHGIAVLQNKKDELIVDIERGDFTNIVDQFVYRSLTAEYDQKMDLLQLIQDPPTMSDLEPEIAALRMKMDELIDRGDFSEIINQMRYNSFALEYYQKLHLLQFIQPPQKSDLIKQKKELQLLMDRFVAPGVYAMLSNELDWTNELLKLINDPGRETNLRKELQDLNNKIDVIFERGIVSELEARDYFSLSNQYDQKLKFLQFIRWKKGDFKKVDAKFNSRLSILR